ncbi:hypothetical protein ACKKBG_A10575 [Auxenochlorella protothecoides x Auxenochlorella symbiontica]
MVVADLKSVSAGFLKPALKDLISCELKGWGSSMSPQSIPAALGPSPSGSTPSESDPPSPRDLPGIPSADTHADSGPPNGSAAEPGVPDTLGKPPAAPAAPALGTPTSGEAELLALLQRLAALDSEGWFQAPVSDIQAPGYSSIIRHPMCIQAMRAKVAAHAYTSWGDFVRDFELLCSNAMRYNQKRSRIHKQALIMLRAGKKLLMEVELDGRRAIAAMARAPGPVCGAGLPPATPALTPLLLGTPQHSSLSLDLASPLSLDLGLTPRGLLPVVSEGSFPALLPLPHPSPTLSDYEATDLEDEGLPQQGLGAVQAAEGPGVAALANSGGAAGPAPFAPAATFLPWPEEGGTGSADDDARAGPGGAQEPWRSARRGAEWRARWLELRLRELRGQAARYRGLLRRAGPEALGRRVVPRGGAAASDLMPQGHPFFLAHCAAVNARGPVGRGDAAEGRGDAAEGHDPALGTHDPAPASREASAAAPSSSPDVAGASSADPASADYPARAYAALELLELRVAALRETLGGAPRDPGGAGSPADGAGADGARGHERRGQRAAALAALQGPLRAASRSTPLARSAVLRAGSLGRRALGGGGAGDGHPASPGGAASTPRGGRGPYARQASLLREGSGADGLGPGGARGPGKRRRTAPEYDIGEMLTPGALGAPKFVERVQVKTIDTPRVRTLSASEWKARWGAISALAAEAGRRGGARRDGAAGPAQGAPSPESSDEDTGDEAYAARHAPLEAAERARYEAAADRPGRNKKPGKDGRVKAGALCRGQRAASAPALHAAARPASPAVAGDAARGADAAAPGAVPEGAGAARADALRAASSAPEATAVAASPAGVASPSTGADEERSAASTPEDAAAAQAAAQAQQLQAAQQQMMAAAAAAAAGVPGQMPVFMVPMPGSIMAAHMAQMAAAVAAAGGEAGTGTGASATPAPPGAEGAAKAGAGPANVQAAFTPAQAQVLLAQMLARQPFGALTPATAAMAMAAAAQHAMAARAAAGDAPPPVGGASAAPLPPALQAIVPPAPAAGAQPAAPLSPATSLPGTKAVRGRGRPRGSGRGRRGGAGA